MRVGLFSCLLLVSEGTNASAPLCSHASLLHTVLQSSLPRRLPPQLTVQSERAADTQAVPYDVLAECIKNKKKMHTSAGHSLDNNMDGNYSMAFRAVLSASHTQRNLVG